MTQALPESLANEPAKGQACRFWALIPCAGRGSRTGLEVPKQYHPVAGRALVLHTLEAFAAVARLNHTLVLLAPTDDAFQGLELPDARTCSSVACGAQTRAGTVTNGLSALRTRGAHDHDWVLVHDAARCLITPELIDRLIDACVGDAVGGLLAVPVSDTVKLASGERVIWAKLSARVGSIEDNRKGGWYGYRASKAALNMVLQTAAIEMTRRRPLVVVAALQPGTVRSRLSHPFVVAEALDPQDSASRMLVALDGLAATGRAHFIDYRGQSIPW